MNLRRIWLGNASVYNLLGKVFLEEDLALAGLMHLDVIGRAFLARFDQPLHAVLADAAVQQRLIARFIPDGLALDLEGWL